MRYKKHESEEERFQKAVELVKGMDAKEFYEFLCGLELAWQAYDVILSGQQANSDDIDNIEQEMLNGGKRSNK